LSKPLLRSASLISFRQTVRELGGDPEALVKKVGLSPQVLDNPELVIPVDPFRHLLNLAAEETGCAYFGLLLSKHMDLSFLGPIGLLLQHSDTVGDALNLFVQYIPGWFQGQNLMLKIDGEYAMLSYQSEATGEDNQQSLILGIGLAPMIMKSLCGESWQPIELHTTLKRPEFADILIQHLEAPIRFGQEGNQIIFKASDLNRNLPAKSGKFGQYLQPLMAERDRLSEDILSHTEFLIRLLLPEGKCSLENITTLLYTSERSLQRNLKTRETSFRQLVDKTRMSIARQQLQQSNLTNSQLAGLLGYTELSAFTRAFKRWFGVAPSKWKRG
jgi:AraC-like DNA-binding protein